MEKVIIVAVAKNFVIGKDGGIPWHSKEDFKHFKNTTLGYPIIMGRKTFESLGKPLKGRLNIVITRNEKLQFDFDGLMVFNNLKKAYDYCSSQNFEKIFIIGGSEIYREALSDADTMIISHMKLEVEGDKYFPEIDTNQWKIISEERFDEFNILRYKRN